MGSNSRADSSVRSETQSAVTPTALKPTKKQPNPISTAVRSADATFAGQDSPELRTPIVTGRSALGREAWGWPFSQAAGAVACTFCPLEA